MKRNNINITNRFKAFIMVNLNYNYDSKVKIKNISKGIKITEHEFKYLKVLENKSIKDKEIVNRVLHNIGLSENLEGYKYFRMIVHFLAIKMHGNKEINIMEAYETIASQCCKNNKAVEKDMRYLKDKSWRYKYAMYIESILGHRFNYNHDIPSNSELVSILVEVINKLLDTNI